MSASSLPQPLTPRDCNLRSFEYMPLDVARLLTSETWIDAADDPKLGHALICLWAESWHQVPAASLPDNDRVLARLSMCERDDWTRVRERALHAWQKCSDGRLYHPVVAEKAREAWTHKLARRERTRKATEERERRRREAEAERDAQRNDQRDEDRNVHRGTGTGTGTREDSQSGAVAPRDGSDEDRFWSRLSGLEPKKISRSRCTELLHLTGNDFIEANRVLDSAEAAEKPGSYLGAIIRNLKAAAAPATNGARDSTVPD